MERITIKRLSLKLNGARVLDFPKYYWPSIMEKKVHRKDYDCHSVYRFILLEPLPEPLKQYSSPLLDTPLA